MDLEGYWPRYLRHHSHPNNRFLHACGWIALLVALGLSLWIRSAVPLAAGVVAAYGLAWTGHFCFQREAPETFQRPVLANVASLRMFLLMVTGKLDGELHRLGITSDQKGVLPARTSRKEG